MENKKLDNPFGKMDVKEYIMLEDKDRTYYAGNANDLNTLLSYWQKKMCADTSPMNDPSLMTKERYVLCMDNSYCVSMATRLDIKSIDGMIEDGLIVEVKEKNKLGIFVKSYEVLERNGSLSLAVLDCGECKYLNNTASMRNGWIRGAIEEIKKGADPVNDGWGGNLDYPDEAYRDIKSCDNTNVIADNRGAYPKLMGRFAKYQMGLETEE